ncbi:MAG: ABC transporter permease [Nitrososphaeria archaeon]
MISTAQLRVLRHFFKLARRDISVRKSRAILTIFGITIGIATLVSLMSIGLGMREQISTELNQLLGVGLLVQGSAAIDIPQAIVAEVLKVPEVDDAYPVIMLMGQTNGQPSILLGIPPGKVENYLTGLSLQEGRMLAPDDRNAIVVQDSFARNNGINVGETVSMDLAVGGRKKFVVVGTFNMAMSITGGMGNFGIVAGNLEGLQQMLDRPGFVSSVVVRVGDRDEVNTVEAGLKAMFPGARIVKEEEILQQINRIMDIINGVLLTMTSVSLIIAGLSVTNTIMMVVRERTREIGTLKSIGAKRWNVLALFLSEAGLLSLAGGISGCILGVVGTYAIKELVKGLIPIPLVVVVSPQVLGAAMVVAVSIGILAGLQPSWKGASIRPIEALRYE